MTTLTQEILNLLDKLYNFRSEDSIIIKEINDEIKRLEDLVKEESEKSAAADNHRTEVTNTLEEYNREKEDFEKRFENLDDHSYDGLRAIGVGLDIGTMRDLINDKNNSYVDSLTAEITSAKKEVDDACSKISSYSNEIEDRHSKLLEAETYRKDLNDMLSQALSSDEIEKDSISKAYVKENLTKLGRFSDTEINELAKLIMFPEDCLAEYDRTYQERKEAGFPSLEPEEPEIEPEKVEEVPTEVPVEVEESKEEIPEIKLEPSPEESHEDVSTLYSESSETPSDSTQEEQVQEEQSVPEVSEEETEEETEEEVVESSLNSPDIDTTATYTNEVTDNGPIEDITPADSQMISPLGTIDLAEYAKEPEASSVSDMEAPTSIIDLNEIKEDLEKIQEKNPENEAQEFLASIGLDADKIANESSVSAIAFYEMIKDTDKKELTNNIDLLKSLNVERSITKNDNGYLYITDEELSKKITYFRSLGIRDTKIAELITDHVDIISLPLNTIEERAKALRTTSGELNGSNITELSKDIVTFANNLDSLKEDFGFELDEKEIRNYKSILGQSTVVPDANILKEYSTTIIKKNGRYALEAFAKTPLELRNDLDLAFDENLNELVSSNPEILGLNVNTLVSRIKYCQEHGISLDSPSDYINYVEFSQKYPNAELPSIITYDEALTNYHTTINNLDNKDYLDILTTILDTHYQNEKNYQEIKLSDQEKEKYNEIFNKVSSILKSKVTDENTLEINDSHFSLHRLERNLKVLITELLSKGESLDDVEKEIVLAATLYGSRKSTTEMEQVAKVCLGFNGEEKLGGLTL